MANMPKVVGAVDELFGDLALALYDQAITRTARVSLDPRGRARQARGEHLSGGRELNTMAARVILD